jgi:hypothetical protein
MADFSFPLKQTQFNPDEEARYSFETWVYANMTHGTTTHMTMNLIRAITFVES